VYSNDNYRDDDVEKDRYHYYRLVTIRYGEISSMSPVVAGITDDEGPDIVMIEPLSHYYTNKREAKVRWDVMEDRTEVGSCMVEIRGPGRTLRDLECERYELNFHEMEDGAYRIMIEATDLSGNHNLEHVYITVDSVRPEIYPSFTEFRTEATNGSLNIRWGASDKGSGIERTDILIDGETVSSIQGIGNETWLEDFPIGDHTLGIRVHDRAGNYNETYSILNLDRYAPDFNIFSPMDGARLNYPDIDVRWEYNRSIPDLHHFEIKLEDSIWVDLGKSSNYAFHLEDEGTWNLSVRSVDLLGNTRTKTIRFTTDYTLPDLKILSPTPGRSDTDLDSHFYIRFTEEMDPDTLQVWMDHSNGSSYLTENGTYVFIPSQRLEPNKAYHLYVNGSDLAGNPLRIRVFYFQTEGEGSMRGIVVDQMQNPVGGAILYLDGTEISRTFNDGTFEIFAGDGDYLLVIEKEGYQTMAIPVTFVWDMDQDMGVIEITREDAEIREEENDRTDLDLWVSVIISSILLIILVLLMAYAIRLKRSLGSEEWTEE
jgi:hypothetical protein